MKKIIVGIFSFVLLFAAQNTFAVSTWNQDPSDCNSISITNATTNEGFGAPCWSGTTVSANPGDSVNVRIYYHNTGTVTATNTSIVLSAPTISSSSTSKSFTGRIVSDQGSLSFGPVSVNLSSAQTLSFYDARWYTNNTSETRTSLLSNGSDVLSGGLNIGAITPGWPSQGSVVVSFKVSSTVVPPQVCTDQNATNYNISFPCTYPPSLNCSINSFSASSTSIISGASSVLNWATTSDCVSVKILPTVGSVNNNGSQTVSPTQDTTYTLTATGANGVAKTQNVSIGVTQIQTPNCSISDFYANPTTIAYGSSSSLHWTTQNCDSVSISNLDYNVPTSSAVLGQNIFPTNTTNYILTANGKGGPLTRAVTVTVQSVVPPNPTTYKITATSNAGGVILPAGVKTYSYHDSESYSVIPSAGFHVESVLIDGQTPSQEVSSYGFYYAFTMIEANHTISAVFAADKLPMTGQISASTSSCLITSGNNSCSIPFTWATQNPIAISSVTHDGSTVATGNAGGAQPFNISYGPQTYYLYNSGSELSRTTVTANCASGTSWTGSYCKTDVAPVVCNDHLATNYGLSGSCLYNQTVCQDSTATNFGSVGACTYKSNIINNVINNIINNSSDNSQLTCNDHSATNYGYAGSCMYGNNQIICQDSYANNYRAYAYCTYDNNRYNTPSVSTYSPTNITNTSATMSGYASGNGSSITTWIEFPCYGTKYGNSYNQYSTNISAPIYSLSPNTTYSYCAAAQSSNNNQIVRGSVVSFRTTGQGGYYVDPVYVNKNVVTTIATNVTQNQAQINGYITNTSYYNSNVYFNYGTTVNMGSRTNSRSTSGNSSFNDVISGLSPSTIYYFQAVGESNGFVSTGSIEIFRTLGNGTVKPIIIQGTTIVGTASPVELLISNKYQLISAGDLVDYVVTYKNIGKSTLIKPMVQVVLPTNTTLVNSSRGTYSVDTHTLSAPVEDLVAGQEGAIYLQARVDSIPLNNAQIVTTAILVYTSTTGAQENIMTYVINIPSTIGGVTTTTGSDLAGAVFFSGLLSIGLIGWLLIILLIMIIILASRSYSRNNQVITHSTTH